MNHYITGNTDTFGSDRNKIHFPEKLAELTKDKKDMTPGGSIGNIGGSRASLGHSAHHRSVTECGGSHPALLRADMSTNESSMSSVSTAITEAVDSLLIGGAVDEDEDVSRVWRQHGESILHHLIPPMPQVRRGGTNRYCEVV